LPKTKTIETKFFHQLEPIMCFLDMKAPRRQKQKQEVTLLFRMALDGNKVRSAPDFIQTAYDGVKEHAESLVELKKEVDKVDIAIFELPNKRQRATFELNSARIQDIAVKEIRSGKGDPSIALTFSTIFPWDSDLWRFLGKHYKTDVFLKFDSAQATLLDLEDEEEEQPDLPGVVESADEAEETEAAEASPAEG
jgi:hypothetical protein